MHLEDLGGRNGTLYLIQPSENWRSTKATKYSEVIDGVYTWSELLFEEFCGMW